MALNVSMMYRRTDRGVREVYEKSHQFTQSERLILILLDGRLNVAGLKTRLPSLNDERIERALRKLQDASLVEPISYEAGKGNGSVSPETTPLEPEAVAQFLGADRPRSDHGIWRFRRGGCRPRWFARASSKPRRNWPARPRSWAAGRVAAAGSQRPQAGRENRK